MSRLAITMGLLAMGAWGIWAVLAKIATRTIAPETAMIVSYAASVVVALGYVAVRSQPVAIAERGVAVALLAGVFGAIGAISFYAGLERGSTAVVTTISALYFVVAAVIGIVFLGESLDLRSVAGVGFAVTAVLLLAQ